jgi:hypothetical protein
MRRLVALAVVCLAGGFRCSSASTPSSVVTSPSVAQNCPPGCDAALTQLQAQISALNAKTPYQAVIFGAVNPNGTITSGNLPAGATLVNDGVGNFTLDFSKSKWAGKVGGGIIVAGIVSPSSSVLITAGNKPNHENDAFYIQLWNTAGTQIYAPFRYIVLIP